MTNRGSHHHLVSNAGISITCHLACCKLPRSVCCTQTGFLLNFKNGAKRVAKVEKAFAGPQRIDQRHGGSVLQGSDSGKSVPHSYTYLKITFPYRPSRLTTINCSSNCTRATTQYWPSTNDAPPWSPTSTR